MKHALNHRITRENTVYKVTQAQTVHIFCTQEDGERNAKNYVIFK